MKLMCISLNDVIDVRLDGKTATRLDGQIGLAWRLILSRALRARCRIDARRPAASLVEPRRIELLTS